MNLAHLVRGCNFKSHLYVFQKQSYYQLSCQEILSLELPSNTKLLILMDFALKGDKNKWDFEAFALKLL